MKFNWNQTGMPSAFVDRLTRHNAADAENASQHPKSEGPAMMTPEDLLEMKPKKSANAVEEWNEWDRKFQALLGQDD